MGEELWFWLQEGHHELFNIGCLWSVDLSQGANIHSYWGSLDLCLPGCLLGQGSRIWLIIFLVNLAVKKSAELLYLRGFGRLSALHPFWYHYVLVTLLLIIPDYVT